MRLVDHSEWIASWPEPSAEAPWPILMSGCLFGLSCGVEGSDYGLGVHSADLRACDRVKLVPFCPEDFGIGTPRTMPDIHDGDGFDVLFGRARVLDEHGEDLTAKMIRGAERMVEIALAEPVRFALLTDSSGACGSQVIYLGCRYDDPPRRQRGVGVATAALSLAGVPVLSQRDFATLGLIYDRLGLDRARLGGTVDHHASDWVREHLPTPRPWPSARVR